ncbi:MAG: hypothetical protein IT427_13600 [Pirellulales bacterium]|nr:hypothetical protein [Pirellulales bacterium]
MFSLFATLKARPKQHSVPLHAPAEDEMLQRSAAWQRPADAETATSRFIGWLSALATSSRSLLLATLVVNSLVMPYRSRYHDSILYGMQVANRAEHQRFADDLFLAYGSQDQFSLFSSIVAPLAHCLGVPTCFFLLYLLGTTAYFVALQRLLRALIPNRILVAVALLGLAVYSPPIGGLGIFHITENFLTPRLFSSSLTLFALERILVGHHLMPAILLAAATAVHPIVAFGGWLVLVSCWLLRVIPRPYFCGLACAISAGTLLLVVAPSLGIRIFGNLDPVWQAEVRMSLPCLFATEWEFGDWLQVAVSTAILLASLRCFAWDAPPRDFLTAVLLTTLLAIAGTAIASFMPFALLVQGQPFRAFWIIQTLQLPLALLLVRKWWLSGGWLGQTGSVALLGYLGTAQFQFVDLAAVLAVFAAVVVLWRRCEPNSDGWIWMWRALAISVTAGLAFRTVSHEGQILLHWRWLTGTLDYDVCLRALVVVLDPLVLFALIVALLALLSRLTGLGRRFQRVVLAIFLAAQIGSFAAQEIPCLRAINQPRYGDIQFVQQFLRNRPASDRRVPTVYWPSGHYEDVWMDLNANSYFSLEQSVGNVFSRATAIEGRRRADLAQPFEIDLLRHRHLPFSQRRTENIEESLHATTDAQPPSIDDLLHLCADQRLDFVVLRQAFPGWYAAHNANWFIYDGRTVRSRAPLIDPQAIGNRNASPRAADAARLNKR